MATDLGDGSCTAFYYMDLPGGDGIARFFPYREGELLYMANVWTTRAALSASIASPLKAGAVEELCELPGGDNSVDGPVYDGAADAIYYVQNGELCMMTGFDPDTIRPVAEFPLNSVHSTPVITSAACMPPRITIRSCAAIPTPLSAPQSASRFTTHTATPLKALTMPLPAATAT